MRFPTHVAFSAPPLWEEQAHKVAQLDFLQNDPSLTWALHYLSANPLQLCIPVCPSPPSTVYPCVPPSPPHLCVPVYPVYPPHLWNSCRIHADASVSCCKARAVVYDGAHNLHIYIFEGFHPQLGLSMLCTRLQLTFHIFGVSFTSERPLNVHSHIQVQVHMQLMCTFVFNVEIINIIILERSNYVTIYNRWEMNCQFLSPFVCSSRNHLLHFWVVQSLPRPASLSLWGKQAPQTENAMLSFWASLFLTMLIMSMMMMMAMIIIVDQACTGRW